MTFNEPLQFDWDAGNSTKNWIKHKVTCEEAEQAFFDRKRLVADDSRSYPGERRYYLLGKTFSGRLLYIAFTLRKGKIRVISARDSNRKEVPFYEKAA